MDAISAINSRAFHAMRAGPRHDGEEVGRIISPRRRIRWRLAVQGRYVTSARLTGLTKTAALEVATFGITACIRRAFWTPLVAKQIPDTMNART